MPDEVQPNLSEAPTHDAQLAAEQIASGEEKAPKVDFEADYAAAQQFSVSEIDRTEEGKIAAEAATAPEYEVPESQDIKTEPQATGTPDDYVEMAKEIGASRTEGVTNVSDDLLQLALQKGEAAKK